MGLLAAAVDHMERARPAVPRVRAATGGTRHESAVFRSPVADRGVASRRTPASRRRVSTLFPTWASDGSPARSVACHRRCLSLVASSVVAPRSPPRSLPTARPAYRAITSLFLLSPRAVSSVLLAHEPPTRATRRPAPTLRRRRSTRAHNPRAGKHGVRPAKSRVVAVALIRGGDFLFFPFF